MDTNQLEESTDTPEYLLYKMAIYSSQFKQLLMLVYDYQERTVPSQYFIFNNPDYYEGKFSWYGYKFQIGSKEELEFYLTKLHQDYDFE